MRLQLAYAQAREGVPFEYVLSAPLDDVFIYFDYARNTALGRPGEWAEGNGYSSGGTSLLYPFVLGLGYVLGFTEDRLMLWAGVIACVSTVVFLYHASRLHDALPRYTTIFLPLFVLGVGGLSWSLFSGMEVAFFLAIWGVALWRYLEFVRSLCEDDERATRTQAMWLGMSSALLAATRPEAALAVAVFSIAAAFRHGRHANLKAALRTLLVTAVPGASIVLGQAALNRVLTGEWSAAGAVAKLEMYHPYMSADAVFDAWWFHIRYQVDRMSLHHLAQPFELFGLRVIGTGYLVWVFAALPLAFKKTRGLALLLWATAISWTLLVALNGQVRWQNERYSMPAQAFLLVAASLGVSMLLETARTGTKRARATSLGFVGVGLCLVIAGQVSQFRDQVWFFARATRNIHEQHVATAKRIKKEAGRHTERVLVGDAGAIPYVSQQKALDLIGLGGYHDFPFARANRYGVASAVELIGRLPAEDRPTLFALYPSWWGDFTTWFGKPLYGLSARGNVICGGLTKMVYEPDLSALDASDWPFSLAEDELVWDRVDVAEVMSEKEHQFRLSGTPGYVSMKMLADPRDPRAGLWDAGRLVVPGAFATFNVALPGEPQLDQAHELLIRVAPFQPATWQVAFGSEPNIDIAALPKDEWQELRVPVPQTPNRAGTTIRIGVTAGEGVLYQVWVVGKGQHPQAQTGAP
jgi:hypothetical protein